MMNQSTLSFFVVLGALAVVVLVVAATFGPTIIAGIHLLPTR